MKKDNKIIKVRRVNNTCKSEEVQYYEIYLTTEAKFLNPEYVFPCERIEFSPYKWWEIQRCWKRYTYTKQQGKRAKYGIDSITKMLGRWIENLGLDTILSKLIKR